MGMEDERPAKRLNTSENDYFEDASKEVLWTDIEQVLKTTETDDAERGWIAGQAFMIFGGRPESKIQLRSRGGRQLQISITCPEHALFTFSIQQAVRISLRGASLSRLKGGTSAPGHLSFNLVFKDGAAVKFMTGGKGIQAGQIIDSWQVRSERVIENEPPVEDWFMSSPIRPATAEAPSPLDMRKDSDLVRASSSSSTPFPETPGRNLHAIHPESSVAISSGDADADADLVMRQDVRELAQSSIVQGSKSLPHDVDLDVSDSNTAHVVDRRTKKP
ncbi:uncharacterized protein FOMMEDRAFT_168761, partial [Fomitiporia mediterranea MF3/22]|uniref:uncharacterized protein n=1 Tax=Fomitiporia mediterranea (strain MF3/22) TaxID=694068 RepID=UPI00044073C7